MISFRQADLMDTIRTKDNNAPRPFKRFIQDLLRISPAYTVVEHEDGSFEFGYQGQSFKISERGAQFIITNNKNLIVPLKSVEQARDIITGKKHILSANRTADLMPQINRHQWTQTPHEYWNGKDLLYIREGDMDLVKIVRVISSTQVEFIMGGADGSFDDKSAARFPLNTSKLNNLGQNSNCVFMSTFPLMGKQIILKDFPKGDDFGAVVKIERGILYTQRENGSKSTIPLAAVYKRAYYHPHTSDNTVTFTQ